MEHVDRLMRAVRHRTLDHWKEHQQAADASKNRIANWTLAAILIAEGYASLSVEILALRRMVPFVGSTVLITAILLSAYLAALAIGYERGGRLVKRTVHRRRELAKRLAWATLLSSWWLSDYGTFVVFDVGQAMMPDGLYPAAAAVTVYSVFCIAPIGWLLAEAILFAHGCAPTREPSQRAGNIFAWSTVGNVGGALITAFVVMTYLGTAWACLIVAGCLTVATLLASPRVVAANILIVAAAVQATSLWIEATNFTQRNAYADYLITTTDDGGRELIVNRQRASEDDPQGIGYTVIEWVEDQICRSPRTRILTIGGAGRTLGRGRNCGPITFVDIDGQQEELSLEFLYDTPAGPLIAADGRSYLKNTDRMWDAIFVDAFTHGHSVPSHLTTREFFTSVREHLTKDGVFYANTITIADDLPFRTRLDRTIRSVFADCSTRSTVIEIRDRWHAIMDEPANRLYRCARSDLDGDRRIYTDSLPTTNSDRGLR